jgi:5-methylcytosine-specific restriction endonuclease McrA
MGSLKFPKPRPQRLVRKDRKAHRKAVIRSVRDTVRQRDPRCRVCDQMPVTGRLEMHEIKSRAQMRGKSPEDTFNTQNCLMCCTACHREVTEHRLYLIPTTPYGADGDILVRPREDR